MIKDHSYSKTGTNCILYCLVLFNSVIFVAFFTFFVSIKYFRSSQCSATGVTMAVVFIILSVG